MGILTPTISLIKPVPTDIWDVGTFNANMDRTDLASVGNSNSLSNVKTEGNAINDGWIKGSASFTGGGWSATVEIYYLKIGSVVYGRVVATGNDANSSNGFTFVPIDDSYLPVEPGDTSFEIRSVGTVSISTSNGRFLNGYIATIPPNVQTIGETPNPVLVFVMNWPSYQTQPWMWPKAPTSIVAEGGAIPNMGTPRLSGVFKYRVK